MVARASNSSREFKAGRRSPRSAWATGEDPMGTPVIGKWYRTVVLLCILLSCLLSSFQVFIKLPWATAGVPDQSEVPDLVSTSKTKILQIIGGGFLFG